MRKLTILFSLTIFSTISIAADGSSGCGPGWYVAKKNSLLSSMIRATTNGLLAPTVTIGMTFGTSNCSKHSIVKREKESLKFATENYYEIATQASKGEGEFLSVFAETIGCSQNSLPQFGQEMKRNFSKIFFKNDQNPNILLEKTLHLIFENSSLRNACFTA